MIPEELVDALNVQKDSLEHLSLSLGFGLRIGQHVDNPQYHLDFSRLESLRVLELDSRAIKLMAPRGRTPMGRLPPNVETLKVFRLKLNPLRDIPDSAVLGPADLNMPFYDIVLLRRIKDAYPRFTRLEYVMEYSTDFDGELEDAIQRELLILVRSSHSEMHRSKFRLSDEALKILHERSATIREKFGIGIKLGILVTSVVGQKHSMIFPPHTDTVADRLALSLHTSTSKRNRSSECCSSLLAESLAYRRAYVGPKRSASCEEPMNTRTGLATTSSEDGKSGLTQGQG